MFIWLRICVTTSVTAWRCDRGERAVTVTQVTVTQAQNGVIYWDTSLYIYICISYDSGVYIAQTDS